ncbi:MAG: hypothetical protein A3G52_01390 [Candidatus Taylorbacteria bacterium RIFCSPLOWO2_12_FULL_43_20]|uniref:Uncharacterized protein n=1 Tax=Candidatus Taylorbacteria bacterium RIFCSPLOWO2_12_FULL_43_20 TaxID=1802332 RepID=A0A1G2P238_9BACT|nr:MAG: hypothetical protein A2825_01895 [Candidatus Taylorbacteria bacterium RIFCSPHIGHO2_01_FULL_43_120]OHA23801.1 MAG: hypothetical protein A3B98_04570 [Candidatus Taylorbacteria bacterium RIFCSPHIGHO2_02_FULL_43_55]OHA29529.1 MAG: hypothetical protein A3E92_01820 [Candidatus Taylorbacteria bacterium RIFCSPHIGHO2_12_FULL_42_34]OHA31333.1 MAG: hypothetical protein A3B09_02255 [Candidatus Taylorbacteria bacterium RIFCSPLOWO2_01_FULL_43_83]OHA38853.1 MAG: hypothetical protein A3H58_00490 [Candi
MDIFIELSIIIAIAAFFSILMRMLNQPLVVGYILAGIATGPYFFNIARDVGYIELFSKIGIAILLFIVGLSLSPKVIKEVGKVSLITGTGQVIFTTIIGYIIAIALGMPTVPALYIATAITFSSTIIILKLLSDKGDMNKLYGKISIGFLIVQDIIATLILISVSSFASGLGPNPQFMVISILLKALAIGILFYTMIKYILPYMGRFFASSQEMLFLFAVAWGLGISSLFFSFGFSMEIGALFAGIILSLTPFSYEIAAKMKPLRDFFIVLFFILLGSQIAFANWNDVIYPAIILSLFILIGNPFIMFILMNLLGYKRKTGFQAGLTVAQISEFSIILVALGVSMGHLDKSYVSLITLVGLVTIALSSYLIQYSDRIFAKIDWLLKMLEIKKNARDHMDKDKPYDISLFGYDRVGGEFVTAFKNINKNFMVIDFNPDSVEKLKRENIEHVYGDAEDADFLEDLPLHQYRMVVSTIPSFETNRFLVRAIRRRNPHAIILITCHNMEEAKELYANGATYVIMPHHLGAKYAANMIMKYGLDMKPFSDTAREHHYLGRNF